MAHMTEMTPEMRQCIQNCLDCHGICQETITHCLMIGGKHAAADHQRTLADCAQACLTCADFMLRVSSHHPQYCGICADICEACAQSCERLGEGDETMRRCADLCRRCEASCRSMALATA
jgi:hypothetical protein